MHLAFSGAIRENRRQLRPLRLSWIAASGSPALRLLEGCPVVMENGDRIGIVDGLIVDASMQKPRFVTLHSSQCDAASLFIPWHSLYFDSALAQLVFYTYVPEE